MIFCILLALAWNLSIRADNATNASLPFITASGVMTMGENRQVLFKVSDANNETASYILNEGEIRNGIKVIAIDESSGTATFDNHGTIQKVTVENAAPSSNYLPPPPTQVRAAAAPVSIPKTTEPAIPQQNGGVSVIVMGNQNNRASFKRISGMAQPNTDNGANNFNSGSSRAPENATAANQPVQSTPTISPAPAVPSSQTSPNGPQEMSVGADMGRIGNSGASAPRSK